MLKQKKAVHVWISWVLLVAFVSVLAAIMYSWIIDYTKSSTEEVKERVTSSEKCDLISISIDEVIQNPQNLNIMLSNRYNLRLNKLIFRAYTADKEVFIKEVNVTIRPEETKELEVSQNETITQLEAIPVIFDEGKEIICEDKKAVYYLT